MKNLKNYDWFSGFMLNDEMDGAIDYVMNNPRAKNDITFYYLVFNIYVEELRKFKIGGQELIVKIDKHTGED